MLPQCDIFACRRMRYTAPRCEDVGTGVPDGPTSRLPPLQCCRKIAVTVLPPSDEGGGFCRRQKTEGERSGAEWEVSLSLPQSSLTLRQLPRQREPKSKRRRERKTCTGRRGCRSLQCRQQNRGARLIPSCGVDCQK